MLYLPVSVFTETEVSDRKHLYQVSIRYRCHTVNKDVYVYHQVFVFDVSKETLFYE